MSIIRETIPVETAEQIYNWLGAGHDAAEFYEGRAKARALDALDLRAGQRVLNVGAGTGKDHRKLCDAVAPDGIAVALDIAPSMLDLVRERTGAPVCRADARYLPFANGSFDSLMSTYVLDLMPYSALPHLLREFHRVLRPEGRMVLVSMTKGVDVPSRLFVAAWEALYHVSPIACGGCRPLELAELVRGAGFRELEREVIVQFGVPSEMITATR